MVSPRPGQWWLFKRGLRAVKAPLGIYADEMPPQCIAVSWEIIARERAAGQGLPSSPEPLVVSKTHLGPNRSKWQVRYHLVVIIVHIRAAAITGIENQRYLKLSYSANGIYCS